MLYNFAFNNKHAPKKLEKMYLVETYDKSQLRYRLLKEQVFVDLIKSSGKGDIIDAYLYAVIDAD